MSVGIEIDEEGNRLLAASGNPAVFSDQETPGIAALGIYDLETGEQLHFVDLAALLPDSRHFANDVAVDADGNAYVTDTFAGVVYKVDPDGNAEVWLEGQMFTDSFVNGIEYHVDGYLLVAIAGALVKVPVDDPEAATPVEMETSISGDGIVLHPDGSLIVVGTMQAEDGSAVQAVMKIVSEDDWATASIAGVMELERQASTAAIRDEDVYVIFPGFEAMGGAEVPETFEIRRVEFEMMEEEG